MQNEDNNNLLDQELGAAERQDQRTKGRGAGVAGFVIGLVVLVFWVIIAGISYFTAALGGGSPFAIVWLALGIIGLLFSIYGLVLLQKYKGKKGLAIAGLIIGLVALFLNLYMLYQVDRIHQQMAGLSNAFNGTKSEMENAIDSIQQVNDTLKNK